MTTLNISFPDSMQSFIQEKIAKGGYGSADEYIRQLVSEDQKRAAWDRLESLVLEGVDAGESQEMTSADWEDLKRKVVQNHAEGKPT